MKIVSKPAFRMTLTRYNSDQLTADVYDGGNLGYNDHQVHWAITYVSLQHMCKSFVSKSGITPSPTNHAIVDQNETHFYEFSHFRFRFLQRTKLYYLVCQVYFRRHLMEALINEGLWFCAAVIDYSVNASVVI